MNDSAHLSTRWLLFRERVVYRWLALLIAGVVVYLENHYNATSFDLSFADIVSLPLPLRRGGC